MTVNDEAYERDVEACVALADFLRDSLRLTGTHLGASTGFAGRALSCSTARRSARV